MLDGRLYLLLFLFGLFLGLFLYDIAVIACLIQTALILLDHCLLSLDIFADFTLQCCCLLDLPVKPFGHLLALLKDHVILLSYLLHCLLMQHVYLLLPHLEIIKKPIDALIRLMI
jgi:hypothetical protein